PGAARPPRPSGWPALDAAGRPPARTAAHGQDGWLGTGSLHGWSCSGGGCSGCARKSCCCPSVASGAGFVRRVPVGCMTLTAAHLVECVGPQGMTRQWVVSVPLPLRYWMASSQDLTTTVHTIICLPILRGISSLRSPALYLAPGRVGGAAAARWAHGRSRSRGEPLQGVGRCQWGARGRRGRKGRCRVGREVSRPGPSPDPDKEISTIRLFRRCDSWLHPPNPDRDPWGGRRPPP